MAAIRSAITTTHLLAGVMQGRRSWRPSVWTRLPSWYTKSTQAPASFGACPWTGAQSLVRARARAPRVYWGKKILGTRRADATPHAAPAPEPPKKRKRWLLWTIIVVVLLWLVSCGALIGALGGDENTAAPAPATTAPQEGEGAESEEPEPEASQPETAKIGEKVTDESYQFTVTKVTCGTRRIGDQYGGETAQGKFCLVSLRVKNIGDDPITFSEENQALVDTKGKQYSPDDEAWIYMDDPAIFEEINPGNTLKAVVPFDVAKKAKPDYLLLKAGTFGFSEGVRVKL